MKIQRVLSFGYALVITLCILIVSTLGSPRPNYFDRNENPELSQWAEQHEDQVHEMANRLRTEYNRATTHDSGQNVPGGTTGCKTTCIPSTTWVSNTGKTQEEISQIAKELTLKLVNDLNSGKIVYNQITQPNWFENYAAHELHLLQNKHYQNNFGTQIHIPQGTYYHKTEKKQVYEYTQGGGNIQPTYIYKPTVTTYEEKKQETQKHSSSGYPAVYYGHGQTVEKIEKQEEHKDIETIAHVPVYTDSYFHSTDRKGHKKVQRRPTAAPAIHVSYNNQEDHAYAQNLHKVYPTTVPVTVTHKEQHMATVEKQTMPIIYKYGNNERRTEQTHHRNRTTSYRRPSTTTSNISRKNTTTTHFETQTRRPSQYSEAKHSIYKHLRTDDGNVPNYKPRVVHKESKVSDYHGFGGGSVAAETIESHQIQNKTISSTNQQTSAQAQINYRPAYVGHQSRYNRTHGYNYTRPGYVIPGGTSQTSQTSQSSQSSHQARPGYAVIGNGQTSQTSSEKITEIVQHRRPGYAITTGGSQNTNSTHSSQTEQHHTRPGYVLIGGGPQTSGISHTSQSSQQTSRPGYIFTGGGGGSTVIQTSYSNHTNQEARPGYIIRPGAHSNQISQNSQSSEHIVRPGYVIAGGGGSQAIETSHSSQTSQSGRPGHVVITGAGSQTVESSETSQTFHQGTRPGYVVVTAGGGSQTVESSHTSQTSQQGSRPGYIFTGGGGSQTVESSEISQTSHQGTRPGYVISGGGGSQTVDTHSSQTLQQGGRPGYVVITGGDGSQTVESSHISQTSHQGTRPGHLVITGGGSQNVESSKISQTSHQGSRPGYIISGGVGSQTIETTHSSQTSHQGGRPGYVIVTGGDGSQTVESSHTNQTSNQGARPGFVVVGGGGTAQTLESYTNQTSEQGIRPGYIITSGGGQTIETSHSSQTSQQSGRPGFVVVSGGGSQTVESTHTSETSQEIIPAEFIITGVGSSQIVENTHSSETIQQGGSPGYVVVGGGGESQIVESSLTNQTTQQARPGYVITGVGGQSVESTYLNHSSQQGGHPVYVVITGGGQSQTVETSHTSQTTQQGARPGYVITSGGGQTNVSSHINQTTEHNRPGYIITSGGGSEIEQSLHSNQSAQHTRPGFIITGGGSQSEITHSNHSSQQTTRPGYVVTGGGSQTIESTQTNQTSQQSPPGYVVIGSGGQTSEISQTNETSEQTSRPGYIVTGGGSQSVESTHSSQTSEQSSRPGYIIAGGGSSKTSQTSHSSNSEEHNSGYLVVGAGGQSSETSHVNQTSEQTSRPGYIITGGGSQTIETSQTSQHSQDNRPGYVVVGGDESQTSQTSLTNQSSVQGSPGFVVIGGGGGSQNFSQEFISQLNQTGGGVYIANGSYISGLGFQEIETNWTSTTNNKKPYIIISKNRGDQPPHHFEDYFDSEEILEKEPGIGFYPTGVKPEIGLLVTGRPPTTNMQGQFNKHRSYGTHNSHSHSSHHSQNNQQTHLYPGSAITHTTHKHHKQTTGTLPGDSRPLLEDHHVDKQSVEEGSSYNNQRSQSVITDNELRESYGFNKSKHHHESNEHRHSGIRHGQQQHSHSRQHTSGRHQHEHRHHHGDGQTGKPQFYFITRDGRRQNVSRHDHEEMLKSQVNVLIENFARTVERDIQNIDPEDDKEAVQVDIVLDNMEKLLLQINSLVGDDPDTKKMIEQLIEHELEAYQKKYRVKRSVLNLGYDSQTTKSTGNSQPTGINAKENIGADLASELFQKGLLSGTVGQLASPGFDTSLNKDSYPAGVNTYNPYDNILDKQSSYDLTQQTQNEDVSQFLLGFTHQPDTGSIKPNTDLIQQYLEEHPYRGSEYDGQENLNEDLRHILDNNQHSHNLDTQEHINFALSPEYPNHPTNNRNTHRIYQPIVSMHPTSPFIQQDNIIPTGNIKVPGTCCWQSGSPNYQLIGSQSGNININVAPMGQKHSFRPINPIYQPIGQSHGFPVPSTTSQARQENVSGPNFNQNKVQIQIDNYKPPLYPIHNPTNKPKESDSKAQPILQTELPITDKQSSYDLIQQTENEDLSQFSFGFTNQPVNPDKTQQHLEQDFSLFDSKNEAESSNIYSGKGDDNHTLKTQSLYDLTQKTQNEDLSQFSMEAKPVGSIKPSTDSIQQHLEEYPYSDLEDDGQETLNEDLTQIIDNNHHSQNLNTQEHVNFALSAVFPNHPTNNQNTYPMHTTSSFITYDPSILAGNIKVPATCCWEPGSPNYQPIGSQTDNINIIAAPVGGKHRFNPINPLYQPIDQTHSFLLPSTTSQAGQQNVSGKIFIQNKTPVSSESYSPPLYPIQNILPSLPVHVAIDKARNAPQTVLAPILQNTDKLFGISSEKSSSLISMYENSSDIEQPNDFSVNKHVEGTKRCCWQSGGPNYQPIGATTDVTNVGTIVGPARNVSPPPCQTKEATAINPTYIPIDGLSESIGAHKPIETIKPNNFEGPGPDRSHLAYLDKQGLVNSPQTDHPDYQVKPIHYPYVTPKQSTVGSSDQGEIMPFKPAVRPVHPSGTTQQSGQEEQSLVDIQQSNYPTYPEEQMTDDTVQVINPGLSVSDSQFTSKETEDRVLDQRPIYPTGSTYQTGYSHGDINYVPVGNILDPPLTTQSTFNSSIGNQKSEVLAYDSFGGLQRDEKTQINQVSDQQTQQSIGSSGLTNHYPSHQNQYGVINEPSGNITYSSVRNVFYPQKPIPIVTNLQTNDSNQQTDQINATLHEYTQYHRTVEENTNTNKIQKSGHSQTLTEIQVNQFINQKIEGNNQSSVQQNTQNATQPMDSLRGLHTYKVEQSKQQDMQQTVPETTRQFSEKILASASGSAHMVHHSIEHEQEKTRSNTQQISTQTPKPKELNKTDNRRGDQTSFDEIDYDDGFYESNVKIAKPDKNGEIPQNTVSLDDYFQYSDSDPELQQLTQQITDADFTNSAKLPQRFNRQLGPISVLDFVPHKSSNINVNSLVSDENDKSVQQAREVMIDYQNHPRNLNHI